MNDGEKGEMWITMHRVLCNMYGTVAMIIFRVRATAYLRALALLTRYYI